MIVRALLQLFLAALMVSVAIAAFSLNGTRVFEGPVVIPLGSGRGLHLLDTVFILVEVVLASLLVYSSRRG